jgi:hypothetical protein
MQILAITRDLFFLGKLKAAIQNLPTDNNEAWVGIFARNEADFREKLAQNSFEVALIDTQATQFDWQGLIGAANVANVPVLAFGRHTEPQLLRQARSAGAYKAVANSAIVTKLSSLLQQRHPNPPALSSYDDYEIEE